MTNVLDAVDYTTLQCNALQWEGRDDHLYDEGIASLLDLLDDEPAEADRATEVSSALASGEPQPTPPAVNSLMQHSCAAFFRGILAQRPYCEELLQVMHKMPLALLHVMLQEALCKEDGAAIESLIALWPRDTLKLREVMVSTPSEAVGMHILRGFGQLHQSSKLECLDMQGFDLDHTSKFYHQMVYGLPMLSVPLPGDVRSIRVMSVVDDILDSLVREGKVSNRDMVERIEDKKILLRLFSYGYRQPGLRAMEGREFVVKLDRLVIQNWQYCYEYTILRNMAGRWNTITILPNQFAYYGDRFHASAPSDPVIKLLHDDFEKVFLKSMDGLDLTMSEMWEGHKATFIGPLCHAISRFQHLRALGLSNWIWETQGEKRSSIGVDLLRSMPKLTRLRWDWESVPDPMLSASLLEALEDSYLDDQDYDPDPRPSASMDSGVDGSDQERTLVTMFNSSLDGFLQNNLDHSFQGSDLTQQGGVFRDCFLECALEACVNPLEYLSVGKSQLSTRDIEALRSYRHAGSLMELDLSVCIHAKNHASTIEKRAVSVALVGALKHMAGLRVLSLDGRPLGNKAAVDELCILARDHLPHLKMVKLSMWIKGGTRTNDDHRRVAQAFTSIPSLQKMCIRVIEPTGFNAAKDVLGDLQLDRRPNLSVEIKTTLYISR